MYQIFCKRRDECVHRASVTNEPPWKKEKRRLQEIERVKKLAQEKLEESQSKLAAARNARKAIYIDKDKLYNGLKERIIGQDECLKQLSSIIRIALAKKNVKRPVTVFLAGNTGCGKTETVIQLVEWLNKNTRTDWCYIRVDCNSFMDSFKASSFWSGSVSGYVDAGKSNFTQIIDNPRAVILLDEVEKCHIDFWTTIMSILDSGLLQLHSPLKEKDKDGNPIKGNEGKEGITEISFKHTIIIMTSNLDMNPTANKVGFNKDDSPDLVSDSERCKAALAKITKPEIAGRVSNFLKYEPLTDESMRQIVRLEIEDFCYAFGVFAIEINDAIVDGIVQSCGKVFGCRSHIQTIERVFGELVAEYSESGEESPMINIEGTLNSIEIVPRHDHEQIDPDELYGDEDEFPF
jgi:ATP-dependent Clp protease ATP-binding subunit ClpA